MPTNYVIFLSPTTRGCSLSTSSVPVHASSPALNLRMQLRFLFFYQYLSPSYILYNLLTFVYLLLFINMLSGLTRWRSGKESACQCRRLKRCQFDPWVGKFSWSGKWQPSPVSLPGEFHGQRSLGCYSSWGHKELDMTE